MSQVKIKANESGTFINVYANNPEFGYITIQSEEMIIGDGWVRNKTRTALLRAEVALLTNFVSQFGNRPMPGHIVVKEFLESELPDSFKSRLNKKATSREDAIAPFIKRAGKGGVELTLGGERILRFTDYDATGNDTDVTVAYDNVTEVAESRAVNAIAGAVFPNK